jgi:hypothetical protein
MCAAICFGIFGAKNPRAADQITTCFLCLGERACKQQAHAKEHRSSESALALLEHLLLR